jgi:hypothetical protein
VGGPNDPSLARSDAAHETARLTREEAVVIARDAAPQAAGRPVTFAEAGPSVDLLPPGAPEVERLISAIPADRWIWVITFSSGDGPLGGESSVVVIDYLDGRVYGVVDWIS